MRAFAELTSVVSRDKPAFQSLVIGGGGYGFPRYLEATYPRATIHVVEIDPAVTAVAHHRLGLRRDTRIITHNVDARPLLAAWPPGRRLDLVFGDAFHDVAMPYHLTTLEFVRLVAARLADDGVYLLNAIDQVDEHGAVVRAFLATVERVFPHVYLLRWGPHAPGAIETLVIAASPRPLDLAPLRERHPMPELAGASYAASPVEGAELAWLRERGRAVVLTDDYAPIEQLTAPLSILRR